MSLRTKIGTALSRNYAQNGLAAGGEAAEFQRCLAPPAAAFALSRNYAQNGLDAGGKAVEFQRRLAPPAAAFALPAAMLLVSCMFAQQPQEMATRELDAPANFRSKVNLVPVPVIVRDKKGNPVGTLKKEDFELFDKGKLQV